MRIGKAEAAALFVAAILLRCGLPASAGQEAAPSIWDGVFSKAQVERGKAAYQASCASCHGDDLVAVDPEAPSLTGPRFKVEWVGKTLGERYQLVRETMPSNDPGSLEDKTYVDVLAFILDFNGYPSGSRELEPDEQALGRILIDPVEGGK